MKVCHHSCTKCSKGCCSWVRHKRKVHVVCREQTPAQGANSRGSVGMPAPGSTFTAPSAVSRNRATVMSHHVTWRHHPESLTKWQGGKKRGEEKWNVGETHSGRVGSGVQGAGWAGSVGGCSGDSCSQTSRTAPAADVGNVNTYI